MKALSDYETTPTTNTLAIQATAGADTLTANFVIDTTNVNEAPSFGAGPYTLTATEGQVLMQFLLHFFTLWNALQMKAFI